MQDTIKYKTKTADCFNTFLLHQTPLYVKNQGECSTRQMSGKYSEVVREFQSSSKPYNTIIREEKWVDGRVHSE